MKEKKIKYVLLYQKKYCFTAEEVQVYCIFMLRTAMYSMLGTWEILHGRVDPTPLNQFHHKV